MLILPESDPLELTELADKAGVSPRTVRYYIQQGLLPAPESRGPGAHYGTEHVDRLLLIRRLQKEHLPLSEIRKRIDKLSPADVKRLLSANPSHAAAESATEYVRRVLSEGPATFSIADRPRASPSAPPPLPTPARSQWDRLSLSPDVELHVRRPVSREENRRIERLIEAAKKIFNEELP